MCGGAAPDRHGHPPWVIVELLAVYPSMKLTVFVDDTITFLGREEEGAGIAEKVSMVLLFPKLWSESDRVSWKWNERG